MISYKYEKEKEIALYLAKKLSDNEALLILNRGQVNDEDQALHLAKFYWMAVDELVKQSQLGVKVCNENNLEEWSELLMASFRAYLRSNGYSEQWDYASDNA